MATLSVIIPCYNAAATLERALAAIDRECESGAPIAEVIVVDDASSDGSPEIARLAGVRLIQQPSNAGDAAARMAGAHQANGDLLWFLDADVEPHPGTAARLAAFMDAHPEFDAAIGSYDDQPSAPGLCSQFKNLMHHFVHQQAPERVSTFWTGCGVVRRQVFLDIGGFNAAFWPGATITDMQFGYDLVRRGGAIAMLHDVQVTHHKRWTLGSLVRTDLFQRAIPWTVLLREQAGLGRGELNLAGRARLGVAATGLMLIALVVGFLEPWLWLVVPLMLALIAWVHAPFLRFLAGKRGGGFALRAFPILVLYDFYCGVGFLLGNLCYLLGWKPRRRPG